MLDEEIVNEKTTTRIEVVDIPFLPEAEYYVRINSFIRKFWFIVYGSLFLFLFALVF